MTPRLARTFGRYKLLDRIASGGMAEVHRAWRMRPDGGRDVVAIKVVLPHCNDDPEFLAMMRDEARITFLLKHPNIAATYEWGDVDERHFLAMEFIDGIDLRTLLSRCRKVGEHPPIEHVVRIVMEALQGLYAAHTALNEEGRPLNLVHRDVSPSNVLISFTGDVKVCDFGIAKAEFSRSRTRVGVVKGKVRYMSPEQTQGRRLDARSDVFSAGVLLYESMTLRAAFGAPTEAEMMDRVRTFALPPPSEVAPGLPPQIDAVVLRALAKRKEARFQTARAFSDSLREVLDDLWPLSSREDLSRFVCELFADRYEYSQRVVAEYEEGERVGSGDSTEIAAPVPDDPPDPGSTLGQRVRDLFRSNEPDSDTPKDSPVPFAGEAPSPLRTPTDSHVDTDELDNAPTLLRSAPSPGADLDADLDHDLEKDSEGGRISTDVAAPIPPDLT